MTLVRLADWLTNMSQMPARSKAATEQQRMAELIAMAQDETDDTVSEQAVLRI